MKPLLQHTKIVATIGPASDSPEMIRKMLLAGMNVARLNFSHGNYNDHALRIKRLREASEELDLALMQRPVMWQMPFAMLAQKIKLIRISVAQYKKPPQCRLCCFE